jgi:hypothetical protein
MGRGRAAGALIAVLISDALIDIVRGGDLVECEPQRVTGDGRHWAYRIVDGRECWYAGRPGKPKNELFWDRAPSARLPTDQPEAETKAEPPDAPSGLAAVPPEKPETTEAMPEQWRASAADQLLAFTCCWPELEEAALVPQPTPEPPAWPLALLPLGLYALWWIAGPRGCFGLFVPNMPAEWSRADTPACLAAMAEMASARVKKFRHLWLCANVQTPAETTNNCRPAANPAPR